MPYLGICYFSTRAKQHWSPVPSLWQEVSAAPAICDGRLHGILSWDKGSVTLGSEGFFTEVHPYAKWIMKTISTHWGAPFLCPPGQQLHDFYTEFTTVLIFLVLGQNPNRKHPVKKKNDTLNLCCDPWSLYTLTASVMDNVTKCPPWVHSFQKVWSYQLLSRHCICSGSMREHDLCLAIEQPITTPYDSC